MKKIVLFVATIVAVSFAACGNKAANTENVDSTAVETIVEQEIAPVVDSAAVVVDSVAQVVAQ